MIVDIDAPKNRTRIGGVTVPIRQYISFSGLTQLTLISANWHRKSREGTCCGVYISSYIELITTVPIGTTSNYGMPNGNYLLSNEDYWMTK